MSILRCSPLRLHPPGDPSAGSAGTACSCRRWGPGDLAARGLVNILGALLSAGDGEARSQSPFISVRPQRGLQPLICRLLAASLQPACYGAWVCFFFFWAGLEKKPGCSWPKGIRQPHRRQLPEHPCTPPACLLPPLSRLLLGWSPYPGRALPRARGWMRSPWPRGGLRGGC